MVVALAFVVEILRVPQVVRVLRLETEFFVGQIQHDLLGIRGESALFPPTMASQTGDGLVFWGGRDSTLVFARFGAVRQVNADVLAAFAAEIGDASGPAATGHVPLLVHKFDLRVYEANRLE